MTPEVPTWHRLAGWLGLILHGAVLIWYAASGLVAPGWAVAVLLVIWAAMAAVAVAVFRRRPVWVPLIPMTAAIIWFGAISAGEAFLNWTA
jgi:hypothetical protein